MREILRQSVFPLYVATLFYPLFYWTDYFAREAYVEQTAYSQPIGLLVMAVGFLVFFSREQFRLTPPMIFQMIFAVWAVLTSIWSVDLGRTAIGIAAFAIYSACFYEFWRMPEDVRNKALLWTALAFFAGVLALGLSLPVSERTFGGVEANLLAHLGFSAIVLLHLTGRFRKIGTAIGFGIIIFAQGRTVLLGAISFLGIYYLVLPMIWRLRSTFFTVTLLVVGTISLTLSYSALTGVAVSALSSVTGVKDVERTGTDLTGRTLLWSQAQTYIDTKPIGGAGFKTRGELYVSGKTFNAHSGVLNLILDLGYIGAGLFFLWYVGAILACIQPTVGLPFRERNVAAAFLLANVPVLSAEPNYISFAHPTAFLMLLTLTFSASAYLPQLLATVKRQAVSGVPKRVRRHPPTRPSLERRS